MQKVFKLKNFKNLPNIKGIEEGKPFPIMSKAKEASAFRVKEAYFKNIIEIHAKLMELAYEFGLHPDEVFKALKEYDDELKK